MKESIEYYYSLSIDKLYIEKEAYHFILNNDNYYFVRFHRTIKDLNDLMICAYELRQKNVYCHEMIKNIKGEYLTKIDDSPYILLKVYNKDQIYSIVEMIQMNKKLLLSPSKSGLYRNDWARLWSIKIDYIESQLSEIKVDNVISKSINYYLGLAENAIYYVNNVQNKYKITNLDHVVLSHKRIYYPNYALNYLNPLTFIFDLEVRDIAEYLKSMFFASDDAIAELETYLKSIRLADYSYNMLFARLLYPSYYFDYYEKIINQHADSEKLIRIISKCEDYELFLKKAYQLISSYAPLEKINWLILKH